MVNAAKKAARENQQCPSQDRHHGLIGPPSRSSVRYSATSVIDEMELERHAHAAA